MPVDIAGRVDQLERCIGHQSQGDDVEQRRSQRHILEQVEYRRLTALGLARGTQGEVAQKNIDQASRRKAKPHQPAELLRFIDQLRSPLKT